MDQSPLLVWISTLTMDSVWTLVKIIYLLAFFLYVLFAIVVVSQVKQMERTLIGGFEKVLLVIGWTHLGVAILALILAFVVL